jgi:competence protein ComEC
MQSSAAIAGPIDRADHLDVAPASRRWPAQIPALYLVALAILAGDAAGNLRLGIPLWLGAALGASALVAFLFARTSLAIMLALGAIAVAAAVAAQLLYDPPMAAATVATLPDDRPIVLEGTLDREPERVRDVIRLYLRVERAAIEGTRPALATGRVRLTVLEPQPYRIGERLRVRARIRLPRNYGDPGEFDYEAYMAREGVTATALVSHPDQIERIGYQPRLLRGAIESIRERIGAFIDAGLDYPERAEMRALIIGDRGGIDRHLRDTFALTGMAHMLIISGLHLGFVASVAFVLIRLACVPIPRLMILGYANKLAAAGSALAVLAYAAIAGTHVSTLRALIMVLCYAGAVLANRSREVLASLALAALIICLAIPGSSMDIGFQLSFAAVLGILLGMRRYAAWWERWRKQVSGGRGELFYLGAGALIGYLAVSFFALLATAPLTAYYFNQFSIIGLIANPVIVPVMALGGVVLGLFAAALSFICRPLADLLLQGAGWALSLGNRLAEMFVRLPDAWVRTFTPTLLELALAYALIGLWLCLPLKPARAGIAQPSTGATIQRAPRWTKVLAGVVLAVIAIDAACWLRERYFDPGLRVTFLSVGQGDAAVVQFPGRAVMLIDGGTAFRDGSDLGERVVGPFLWSRKIMRVDYLVLSHPEIDHFGGFIFIARNFHPAEFWATGASSPDVTYGALLDELAKAGVRSTLVNASSPARRIGGVTVRCLSPEPASAASRNNSSMVLQLQRDRFGFLFTGDLESLGEHLLLQRDLSLHATVLKVPHHGSITSSSPQFVNAVSPAFAVISAGYHNRYHFPAAAVVARYRRDAATVLRTDQLGAIGFAADHDRLRMWTVRPLKPPAPRDKLIDTAASKTE